MSTRHETAEAIVRDLAASSDFWDDWDCCVLCSGEARTHKPSCPWLRAQAWVSGGEQ